MLDESNHKPNKILVDKANNFYNISMKWWLEKYAIEMYATHNEGKSVVAERIIRTLKNKIYTWLQYVYINKLDDIVNRFNNTYHRTIKMKPVD